MPAVVTSVGGIPEAVEHEETGLVVPTDDPESLANALLHLLRHPKMNGSVVDVDEIGRAIPIDIADKNSPGMFVDMEHDQTTNGHRVWSAASAAYRFS